MDKQEAQRIGREAKADDPANIRYRVQPAGGEWCVVVWDKRTGCGFLECDDARDAVVVLSVT